MSQGDLFAARADDWFDELPEAPVELSSDLRWYQQDCVRAVMDGFRDAKSQLIVMATGTGKTVCFTHIAQHWNEGDVLVLAHRDELVSQARDTIERVTGELVEVEQAELQSSAHARIVVGSVQSFNAKRLNRLGKERFGLVIIDEAHHAVAPSYRRVFDFFSEAHLLGVTATPDRADEKALGAIFESVPFLFDIKQGIESGYLVPVKPALVNLVEVDISHVSSGQGEGGLNLKELDEAMMRAVEGIVHKTLELEPGRHGIWFWPGVRTSEYAANRVNAFLPESSAFISGETPDDERRRIVSDFKRGKLRHIHNCNIATEGFDAPNCDLIVHGRPTKSRALQAQMVGRGTRVLPGVVDPIKGRDESDRRRAAIAASAKPDVVCLDFVGNWGRHEIVSTMDVLGGSFTEAEVKEAKKKQKSGGAVDALAALEEARRQLKAMAQGAKGKVVATVQWLQPFNTLGVKLNPEAEEMALRFGEAPITGGQFELLVKRGLSEQEAGALTKVSASRLLNAMSKRMDQGLASYKQLRLLEKFGLPNDPKITFERATAGINYIKNKNWSKSEVSPLTLKSIVYNQKELPNVR